MNWPPQRDSEADVSSVGPSSEQIEELWVASGLYAELLYGSVSQGLGTTKFANLIG